MLFLRGYATPKSHFWGKVFPRNLWGGLVAAAEGRGHVQKMRQNNNNINCKNNNNATWHVFFINKATCHNIQIKAKISDRWFGYGKRKIVENYKGIRPKLRIDKINKIAEELLEIHVKSKGIEKLILQSSIDGGKIWNNEQTTEPKPSKKQEVIFQIKQRFSSMIYRVIAPN